MTEHTKFNHFALLADSVAARPARSRPPASRVHAEQRLCRIRRQVVRQLSAVPRGPPLAVRRSSRRRRRTCATARFGCGSRASARPCSFSVLEKLRRIGRERPHRDVRISRSRGSSRSAPFTSSPPSKAPSGSPRTWSGWRSPRCIFSSRSTPSGPFSAGLALGLRVRHPAAPHRARGALLRARGARTSSFGRTATRANDRLAPRSPRRSRSSRAPIARHRSPSTASGTTTRASARSSSSGTSTSPSAGARASTSGASFRTTTSRGTSASSRAACRTCSKPATSCRSTRTGSRSG